VAETELRVRTRRSDEESGRRRAFDPSNILSPATRAVYNTFNIGHHLTTALTHRILKEEAFDASRISLAAIT
jgi:hypothetical protein